MGIRFLHSFAKKVVPNGLQPVDMEEEAREYQRLNKRKPILVIDLAAFHVYVYRGVHERLLGGRFEIFNERLHGMLSKLRSLGFEMVFFARGANDNIDRELNRREKSYERTVRILHAIDEGLDLCGDWSEHDFRKLDEFFGNLIHISREYGELHTVVANKYKPEIVYQAKNRDALAIVSNDTDFLIFGGSWRFWRDLDFDRHTAYEYNKAALRRCLRLSESQMVLFASLVGSKFIPEEILSAFLQSLHCDFGYYKKKFYKVAAYIRNMPLEIQSDIKKLARDIFTPADYVQGMELLQENINFFRLIGMQNTENSDEFLRRVADLGPRDIYILLKEDSIIESCAYIDLSKTIFPPYFDFYKPLLCRLMGVLFWNQEKRDFSKTFYFKLEHCEPFAPVELHAVYPAGDVPPVEDLLLTPYGENEDLDDRRWELLCFMISPKLKTDVLRSVPGLKNLATYATLFFLVTENLIQVDEADCILISCEGRKPFPELQDQFTFEKVKTIDGRDARIAFMFLRIMRKIYVCFSAAGLKKYAGLITFDGLCFHNLRKVWNEIDSGQLDSVREELKEFRIYAQV